MAIHLIAEKIGCSGERLRKGVRQAERDHGRRAGPRREERERLAALERENRELRQANEILRKPPEQIGFAVHPRRWVVERFLAWIGRNRRLAKDFGATLNSARAFLYAASVMLLVRRLGRAL